MKRRWMGILAAGLLATGCFDFGTESGSDVLGGTDAGSDTSASTGLAALHDSYLKHCANCHAPGAPGATSGTETSLNFSTVETTRRTLKGQAAGLTGNQQGCNGVPFLGATWQDSLLAAVLDENLRPNFVAPGHPECNGATGAVSRMDIRISEPMPASFLADLRAWIEAGAP